jgi:hypothetical protein
MQEDLALSRKVDPFSNANHIFLNQFKAKVKTTLNPTFSFGLIE